MLDSVVFCESDIEEKIEEKSDCLKDHFLLIACVGEREKESEEVLEYQRTRNMDLLHKLYMNRVPTIQNWATKYFYLSDSVEDMFQNLALVFLKSVEQYKIHERIKLVDNEEVASNTPFNTFLYYALENFIKNIKINKGAKKRTTIHSKPAKFLSLDYQTAKTDYLENEIEETKEHLRDSMIYSHDVSENMFVNELITLLTNEEQLMNKILWRVVRGDTMSAILKSFSIQEGHVPLDSTELPTNLRIEDVYSIIGKHISSKFYIQSYKVVNNELYYRVKLQDNSQANKVLAVIRRLRKNKSHYYKKLFKP